MDRALFKIAASVNLLIGVTWACGVAFMFLTLAAISTPISTLAVIESFVAWFAGPVCLIAASITILLGKLPRASLTVSAMAAVVLTGIVGNTVWAVLHPQPLEAPPTYGFYCLLVGATLLCDFCNGVLVAEYKKSKRTIGAIPGGTEE